MDDPMDDRVIQTLRAAAGDAAPPGSGRVLQVKLGYNPNSSSVGSVVSLLFWSATAAAAALNLTAALLARRQAAPPEDTPDDPGGAPPEAP